MNVVKSSIRMIPQASFSAGRCGVCGEDAILKWFDSELTHGFIGNCCFVHAMSADRVLAHFNFARPQEKVK